MTHPPPPGPDGTYPPPPDPPIQAYQPPVPPTPRPYGYDYGSPYAPPGPVYPSHPGYAAYPYAPPRRTEGLAIGSLVVSCVGVLGLCFWSVGGLLGFVGAILGHVARRRIRDSGADGSGLALAGIIVGWICTAIAVIGALALASFLASESGSTY